MDHGNVIIRFSDVSFGYDEDHPTLEEASFSVRENAKITLMGQNGAGKSTIFKLITGELAPREGGVHIRKDATIATALTAEGVGPRVLRTCVRGEDLRSGPPHRGRA